MAYDNLTTPRGDTLDIEDYSFNPLDIFSSDLEFDPLGAFSAWDKKRKEKREMKVIEGLLAKQNARETQRKGFLPSALDYEGPERWSDTEKLDRHVSTVKEREKEYLAGLIASEDFDPDDPDFKTALEKYVKPPHQLETLAEERRGEIPHRQKDAIAQQYELYQGQAASGLLAPSESPKSDSEGMSAGKIQALLKLGEILSGSAAPDQPARQPQVLPVMQGRTPNFASAKKPQRQYFRPRGLGQPFDYA